MSIIAIILIGVGLILVMALLYLASLPGKFTVEESVFIAAPKKKVFAEVINFRSWREWSPWVLHEPTTKITYSRKLKEVGGNYSWDGKYIGAGTLTHAEIKGEDYIKQNLTFSRPMKSTAVTEWKLKETTKKVGKKEQKGTEVKWILHSSMPFFLRFLTPFIKKGIALDYRLGLLLLAQNLDAKADKLRFKFKGVKECGPVTGWYESFTGHLSDLPMACANAFQKFEKQAKADKVKTTGAAFIAYHKMNPKTQKTTCDFVWPVPEKAGDTKTYSKGKYLWVEYKGSYQYMDIAWNTAMSHLRMMKHKWSMKLPACEVYETDPRKVKSPNDYKTILMLPTK